MCWNGFSWDIYYEAEEIKFEDAFIKVLAHQEDVYQITFYVTSFFVFASIENLCVNFNFICLLRYFYMISPLLLHFV